jgi:hypothetical protein
MTTQQLIDFLRRLHEDMAELAPFDYEEFEHVIPADYR